MTNPIFAYGRSDGCGSITGGAFVPNGVWLAEYEGRYLFADYNCVRIFRLNPAAGGGFNRVDFRHRARELRRRPPALGPWNATQALYYTSYANGGQIRRITATAPAPTGIGAYTSLTPDPGHPRRHGRPRRSGRPTAIVDVQITGRGGIPSGSVSAGAMNVTVTPPTGSGYLTLFPSGTARPLAANLNFDPGKTVPNLVVAKLGAGGKVAMFNSAGDTHVIFDVAGWYSDAGAGHDGCNR